MSEIEKMVREFTESRLSATRLEHVRRVVETIETVATARDLDVIQARTAAWLHDAAKEEKKGSFKDLVERGEIEIDEETFETPKLWHGFHAAYWGRTKFAIDNEDLLEAVRYHPTGAPGMSDYGQALFIADYCEPGREIPGTAEIVETAKSDLNAAALRVVEEKIRYVRENKGKEPHSRSIAYRKWLIDGQSN
ncbi:MAG: bis(5'-nucleosyl)-tetraphosphatase (symmetrical) YqeK [Candidatus Omnitrophica bacterium]|nr:bis(5'-nucleosyl)-tetraphosphatase (symmetrical) YqeK [Candidatus Omnitrophota bacterium]